MSRNFDNTNRISLWPNDDKQEESHADLTGTLNVDGTEYFVDLWKKKPDAKDGAPVLSGRIKLKRKQGEGGSSGGRSSGRQQQEPQQQDDFDDEVPF